MSALPLEDPVEHLVLRPAGADADVRWAVVRREPGGVVRILGRFGSEEEALRTLLPVPPRPGLLPALGRALVRAGRIGSALGGTPWGGR